MLIKQRWVVVWLTSDGKNLYLTNKSKATTDTQIVASDGSTFSPVSINLRTVLYVLDASTSYSLAITVKNGVPLLDGEPVGKTVTSQPIEVVANPEGMGYSIAANELRRCIRIANSLGIKNQNKAIGAEISIDADGWHFTGTDTEILFTSVAPGTCITPVTMVLSHSAVVNLQFAVNSTYGVSKELVHASVTDDLLTIGNNNWRMSIARQQVPFPDWRHLTVINTDGYTDARRMRREIDISDGSTYYSISAVAGLMEVLPYRGNSAVVLDRKHLEYLFKVFGNFMHAKFRGSKDPVIIECMSTAHNPWLMTAYIPPVTPVY